MPMRSGGIPDCSNARQKAKLQQINRCKETPMDGILVLAILAILAIPVSILVLFLKLGSLRARINALEKRLADRPAEQTPAPEAPVVQREAPAAAITPWQRAAGTATPAASKIVGAKSTLLVRAVATAGRNRGRRTISGVPAEGS